MSDRAELERLRAKYKDPYEDRAELERLRAKYSKPQQESFQEVGPARAWTALAEPLVKLSNAVDPYVGAPIRAGLQETINERNESMREGLVSPVVSPRPIEAAYKQFGEDPSKAPSWESLASQYGLSQERDIPFPTVKKPFSPNARFEQTNVSSADIGGGVMGAAMDPTGWVPGKKIASLLGKAAAEGGSLVKSGVIKPGARLGMHVGMSVKPQDFDYYVANQPRLKGQTTQGTGPIVRDIISDTQGVKGQAALSEQAVDSATAGLQSKADDLKQQMRPDYMIDAEHVEPWQESLELDKKWQAMKSAEADEILGSLPITAPKKTIIKKLDELIKEYPAITQGNQATQNSLTFIRNGLDQNYSDYLNGPQLRDWMRTVRKEIEFKRGAGEYTGDLDKALQSVTEFVSDSLKDTAPEYRKVMNQMSQRSRANEDIRGNFADEAKGMRYLRKTQDKDPGTRALVQRDLAKYAETTEQPEMLDVLKNYEDLRKRREMLDKEGYMQAFPNEQQEIADLGGKALTDQYRAQELRDFTDKGTHRIVKDTGMFHGGNPQNQQAMASLQKNFPEENYPQRVRDEGVLHAFSVERPMGARATLLGSALGGWLGGELGIPAGAVAGATMDKMGGTIARSAIDTGFAAQNLSKAIATKLANPSPKIMPYLKVFDKAAEHGTKGILFYHQLLYNNDPEYRKAFNEE